MNYLMHLYFSADDPESLVGNMMGDFVKGRLDDRFPPGVRDGIMLHRGIDSFAAANLHFLTSKRRIDPLFRHYRAVLVDIFYDHFLARRWDEYSSQSFESFIGHARRVLTDHGELLPERLRELLPRMFSADWLLSYRDPGGIGLALTRMSARIARPNPLAEGIGELLDKGDLLLADFRSFMEDLRRYTDKLHRKRQ
jgi:acyl carrier protein phosphodiesterase